MAVGNPFAKSQGFDFVSNNKYLQEDFTGSTPLDFSNISSSGIMSQAPYIYPPINGDDRPIDTGPTDYGYESIVDKPNFTPVGQPQTNFEYDIEEGTIDDEDIENNQVQLNKMDLVKAGISGMFLGPFSGAGSIYRSQKKAEKEMRDKIDADIAADIREAEVKGIQGRLDSGMSLSDIGRESYTGAGMAFEERDTGTGRGPKKDGGRAGYFFGGRVNYKDGGLAGLL